MRERRHVDSPRALRALRALVLGAACASAAVPALSRDLPTRDLTPLAGCLKNLDLAATGHSPKNAYLMALVAHQMYPHAYDPHPGDNLDKIRPEIKRVMKSWGMDSVDVLAGGPKGGNNIQYAVMSNDAVIIVAFRGSDSLLGYDNVDDWIKADANARQVLEPIWGRYKMLRKTPTGGSETVYRDPGVHRGFRDHYWAVRDKVNSTIARHGGGTKQLFITGHSLGGALSTLCAIDQATAQDRKADRRFRPHSVYTFGSPRVGNGFFAKLYKQKVASGKATALNTHRYWHYDDVLALFPGDDPATTAALVLMNYGVGEANENTRYTHVGATCNINPKGGIAVDAPEFRGTASVVRTILGSHGSKCYAERIYFAFAAGSPWKNSVPSPPEFPAGQDCD